MQTNILMNVKEEGERRHLVQEIIIAQEDVYRIWLFGRQKYIEII